MKRHSQGSRVALAAHTTSVRPLYLPRTALALLLLLDSLLTVLAPIPAWAQFAYTTITNFIGSGSYWFFQEGRLPADLLGSTSLPPSPE